ncbi:MAG: dihydropteroate synthase [Bacteroidia bacterium]|jgi:dihydropteroate synthase|nr:dihydropteroate synthase [Bacteroidia bacterium]
MKRSIHIKDTVLHLDTPQVMGILNVTPDSFSDGGKYDSLDSAMRHAEKMMRDGADILDIGGYSSRPGASEVSLLQELARVIPVVRKAARNLDVVISIDTFRSEVAQAAIEAGAHIVNDISAGEDDSAMLDTVAKLRVPYIAMHKQGPPKTMQHNPTYGDVVKNVFDYLLAKKAECTAAGIRDIIIDPGFGFGKTQEHNYTLLRDFDKLQEIGTPILAGVSRKSMIYKYLKIAPEEAVNGSSFLHAFALQGGANILRVHDVREAVECVKLYGQLRSKNRT